MSPLKQISSSVGFVALALVSHSSFAQSEMAQIPALVSSANAAIAAQDAAAAAMNRPVSDDYSVLDAGAPAAGSVLGALLAVSVVSRRKRRKPN
jgi:hypothetical protein